MESIKKILFPIDLTEVSPKIAPVALEMARKFDAELHVVCVTEPLDHYTYFVPDIPVERYEIDMKKAAESKLEQFEQEFCQGCTRLVRVALRGDPAEEILKYIGSADINLVVMGTHGRKGLDRVMFGSVAERVVREAPIPVLTVNPYRKKK